MDSTALTFSARDRLKLLAGGGAALALAGCGGGGGSTPAPVASPPPPPPPPPPVVSYVPTVGELRGKFTNNFRVGAAVQVNQLDTALDDGRILAEQFNSLTGEYEMKPDIIGIAEGEYDWSRPDAMMDFAEANGLAVRGHTLCWHVTAPEWMLSGTPADVKRKLQRYITDVLTRYKGRIYAWDVVNEVITDDDSATDPYRRSNWWDASGGNADYIDWAFEAALAADPDAMLHINDYSTEFAGKRGRLVQVVQDLQARGFRVDGIGHQMHINIGGSANQVLDAVDDIDNQFMGLEQHITELDISIYSDPGSCFSNQSGCQADLGNNIPADRFATQARMYRDIFNGLTSRPSVNSVTVWGLSDATSWLDRFPVNRTNAPLLYDRDRDAKPAFQAIVDDNFTP